MRYRHYLKKIAIYSRKLQKMTPGQRRSWYARWMNRRLVDMTAKVKKMESAVGFHSLPVGNYTIPFDELPKL